jgi:hypothetical protein
VLIRFGPSVGPSLEEARRFGGVGVRDADVRYQRP